MLKRVGAKESKESLGSHPGEHEKKGGPALVLPRCAELHIVHLLCSLEIILPLPGFWSCLTLTAKKCSHWRARHCYWVSVNHGLVLATPMNYVCAWERLWQEASSWPWGLLQHRAHPTRASAEIYLSSCWIWVRQSWLSGSSPAPAAMWGCTKRDVEMESCSGYQQNKSHMSLW